MTHHIACDLGPSDEFTWWNRFANTVTNSGHRLADFKIPRPQSFTGSGVYRHFGRKVTLVEPLVELTPSFTIFARQVVPRKYSNSFGKLRP